jgi:hypothetical protein
MPKTFAPTRRLAVRIERFAGRAAHAAPLVGAANSLGVRLLALRPSRRLRLGGKRAWRRRKRLRRRVVRPFPSSGSRAGPLVGAANPLGVRLLALRTSRRLRLGGKRAPRCRKRLRRRIVRPFFRLLGVREIRIASETRARRFRASSMLVDLSCGGRSVCGTRRRSGRCHLRCGWRDGNR